MRKTIVLMALALASVFCCAQNSDIAYRGALNTTCAVTNTNCGNQVTAPVPNIGPPSSVVEVPTRGYGVATVTVSGTYVGLTLNFEFTDDGGNNYYSNTCTRTDAPIQEVSELLPTSQSRSWDCGVAGSVSMRVRASTLTSGVANIGITLTTASIEPAPTVQTGGLKYTNITTSTNTLIQNTPLFVHTITITQPGATSNQITIYDASTAGCTGGTTIMTIPSAQLVSGMTPVTITLDISTNNGLCVTTAGTTAPQLVITYR